MIKYVVGLHEAPNDLGWWSEHLKGWTDNIFAATTYSNNEAVKNVEAMKGMGIKAYTEMLQIATKRHQRVTQEIAQ